MDRNRAGTFPLPPPQPFEEPMASWEPRRRLERHDEPRRPNHSEPPLEGGRAVPCFLIFGTGCMS